MKVKDLLAILAECDPETEVVTLDHFGRPMELDSFNFRYQELFRFEHIKVLAVSTPDIGPAPD